MLNRTGLFALAATALLAGSADALTLGAPGLANSSTQVNINPAGATADAARGTVSGTNVVTPTNGTTFATRYFTTGGQGVGGFYFQAGPGTTGNSNYTITFSVTHTNGQGYFINIGTSLLGVLTGRGTYTDAAERASAAVGPVSGSHTGGGTLFGSLGLAGTTTLGVYNTAGTNFAINRSGSATIFNVGTGAAQVYTLNFTFTSNAIGLNPNIFIDPDDSAFRLGLATSTGTVVSGSTVEDYAGVGARNGLNDGHFVTITLAVPEPGTLLLLAAGTAGLALIGRKRA